MTEYEGPRISTFMQELKRPTTIIAIGLTIVSVLLSILTSFYFCNTAQKSGQLAFTIEQIQIFQKEQTGSVPLTVHDVTGNVINENVYAANLTVWNAGTAEIKKEDVREPFRISLVSESESYRLH
jgi:hypothetical protein